MDCVIDSSEADTVSVCVCDMLRCYILPPPRIPAENMPGRWLESKGMTSWEHGT